MELPERQEAGPREVLERLRQAAISQSAEDMRRLYAEDAVHEFRSPPGPAVPARGPRQDRELDRRGLDRQPAEVRALPDSRRPRDRRSGNDHRRAGSSRTSATAGEFALPNIVVLTVREGQIVRLRDYVNILAAAAAIGRDM